MLLHFCPVGVTMSWEEAHPGARASRPHKSSRSFGHLLHRNQPAAALCFGRAHAVPAGRAVGCNIAGKLSGNRRDSMRAGRPRSRGVSSRWCGGGCPAGDFSESRPVPFGKLPSLLQNSLGSGIYCREELLSLGARASRPHKTWQGRGDWLHRVGRFTRRLTLEQRLDKYAGGTPALPGGNPWLARCRSLSRALFFRSILPPSHARLRILQKALPFVCEPGARPPRLGRSIEKDYKLNIDAQDTQDNQDGRLLQETLTRAMIVCGFEDVREHKPAVSGKNPVHPVHRCESKIYPCLTMNRFPATRRRRLFQVSPASALPCGSFESETIGNRQSCRDLGIPSRLTSTP